MQYKDILFGSTAKEFGVELKKLVSSISDATGQQPKI